MAERYRFLHLEDDEADADLLQSLLELEGIDCSWERAWTEKDFAAKLAQGQFDLILADYALPSYDGGAALGLAQRTRPDIPFIFVSGAIGEERVTELMRNGATDCVLKTRLIRLAPCIQRALREAQERKDLQAAQTAAERTTTRQMRLHAITAAFSRALSPIEVARVVMDQGLAALEAAAGAVVQRVAPERMEILMATGYRPDYVEAWRSFALTADNPLAEVARTGEPQWLSNPQDISERYAELIQPGTPVRYGSRAAVPLIVNEQVVGSLIMSFVEAKDFDPEARAFIQSLADQCAQALERARLYEAERKARNEAMLLADAGRLLVTSLDSPTMLERLARLTLPHLGDYCSLFLLGEDQQVLVVGLAHVDPEKEAVLRQVYNVYRPDIDNETSWLGRAIRTGESVWMPEIGPSVIEALPDNSPLRAGVKLLGPQSAVTVPLAARGRMVGGMVLVYAESGRRHGSNEVELAEALGRRIAMALDNLRLYAEAQRLNGELEERVAQRTEELRVALERRQAANQMLETEINERREAENIIRRSQQMLAEAQQIAHLGSWHWDVATNVVSWSDEMHRIYGLQPGAFDGSYQAFLERVHPDDREAVAAKIADAFETRRPFAFDHRIVRPDGAVRTLNARGDVAVDEATGAVAALRGTGQDMTERKQIEEELLTSREHLRQLSEHLHAAREDEQKRIAREIHDELGGTLTGLKMQLAALRNVPDAAQRQQKLTEALAAIDATIGTVRRIATELRPSMLDNFGLVAALEWQVQEFEERSEIECLVDLPAEDVELDSNVATAVFRIFQETLTNVARHSQATQVDVRLEALDGHLVLNVRDNGRGITPQDLIGSKSLGILGMHERVRALAGELQIDGAPGEGTAVLVRIPLHRKQTNGAG